MEATKVELCRECGEIKDAGEVCRNPRPNWRAERLARIRRASSFIAGDDRLSRAATELRRWTLRQDSIEQDLEAFSAPGECWPLAFRGEQGALTERLAKLGYTPEKLRAEIRDRTSPLFTHVFCAEM